MWTSTSLSLTVRVSVLQSLGSGPDRRGELAAAWPPAFLLAGQGLPPATPDFDDPAAVWDRGVDGLRAGDADFVAGDTIAGDFLALVPPVGEAATGGRTLWA